MVDHNIFLKIIKKQTNTKLLYQDNFISAFYDNNPQAPIHILIVPNLRISTVNDVIDDHEKILGKLFIVASKLAKKLKIDKSGYRLIINCNRDAGQEIYHLHMHLLGGKPLGPLIINHNIS